MAGSDLEKLMDAIDQVKSQFNRLVLVAGQSGSGKTELLRQVCNERDCPMVNVNLQLSQKLIEFPRSKRLRQIDRIFGEILNDCESDLILLDDIEVLFDPTLKVDPYRLLKNNSRNKTLVASWNGTINERNLSYAEPDHPEYKSYRDVDVRVVSISKQASASR
jgi:Cdc6-like AAA superfamily ATPase